MDQALANRPDPGRELARLRAREADVSKAKAGLPSRDWIEWFRRAKTYKPLQRLHGWKNHRSVCYDERFTAINLTLSWNIFDGFLRRNKLREADAHASQAAAELSGFHFKALREVWKSSGCEDRPGCNGRASVADRISRFYGCQHHQISNMASAHCTGRSSHPRRISKTFTQGLELKRRKFGGGLAGWRSAHAI